MLIIIKRRKKLSSKDIATIRKWGIERGLRGQKSTRNFSMVNKFMMFWGDESKLIVENCFNDFYMLLLWHYRVEFNIIFRDRNKYIKNDQVDVWNT